MMEGGRELWSIKHLLCVVSVGTSITVQLRVLNNGGRKTEIHNLALPLSNSVAWRKLPKLSVPQFFPL